MKLKRKSKSLQFNGAIILILSLVELAATTFTQIIPGWAYATMIYTSAAGNMLIRFYTSEPIR